MVDLQTRVKKAMLVLVEVQVCPLNEDNLMHEVFTHNDYIHRDIICIISFQKCYVVRQTWAK